MAGKVFTSTVILEEGRNGLNGSAVAVGLSLSSSHFLIVALVATMTMRHSSDCVTAIARQVSRKWQSKRPFVLRSMGKPAGSPPGPGPKNTNHILSAVGDELNAIDRVRGGINGINGESSAGNDIIESAAAAMIWKRNHFRKIENRFQQPKSDASAAAGGDAGTKNTSPRLPSWPVWPTDGDMPLAIEKYEDVQPIWKGMESRVTKRKSLTLTQRGGVSGRRNVRRSDEDLWLEAGVYDDNKETSKND
jgi:hypothetical protein